MPNVSWARTGHAQAWTEIVRAHERDLFRLAAAILRNDEDAQDVCQEAFHAALQNIADFDPAGRLDLWLRRIVINRARDILRRRKVREATPEELSELPPPPDRILSDREDHARVRQVMEQLPMQLREALILHLVEDRPYPELAQILDVSVNAVRIRVHRALAMIRTLIVEDAK